MEIQSPCLESSRFQIRVVSNKDADNSAPEYLTWDVLVNGQSAAGGTVDPGALIDSWSQSGWHQILTCGCGISDCADLAEGIYVRREPMAIYWTLRDPYFPKGWRAGQALLRYRTLRFDPDEYHTAILQAIDDSSGPDWDQSPRRLWPYGFDWHSFARARFNAAAGHAAPSDADTLYFPARIEVGRWLADRGSTLTRDVRSSNRYFDLEGCLHRDEELLARWMRWQDCFDERGHARAGLVEEHLDEIGLGFALAIKRCLAPASEVRYLPVEELRPPHRPALSCLQYIAVVDADESNRIRKET